jgi:hypothetical protein
MVDGVKGEIMIERFFDTVLYALWFLFGYSVAVKAKKDKGAN